jgi:predicted transcriptional regulator
VSIQASAPIADFARSVAAHHNHTHYPVYDNKEVIGLVSAADLGRVAPADWERTTVGAIADRAITRVAEDCDLSEALRLLVREGGNQLLLVTHDHGARISGVITKTDILRMVGNDRLAPEPQPTSGPVT